MAYRLSKGKDPKDPYDYRAQIAFTGLAVLVAIFSVGQGIIKQLAK